MGASNGKAILAQSSHSATVPLMIMERGAGPRMLAPSRWWGADPGVRVQPVAAGPAGEVLHGCQRVAALQRGADMGRSSAAARTRWLARAARSGPSRLARRPVGPV